MASGCVPGSGGRLAGSFIADLPLGWYTGCVIEYLSGTYTETMAMFREGALDSTIL